MYVFYLLLSLLPESFASAGEQAGSKAIVPAAGWASAEKEQASGGQLAATITAFDAFEKNHASRLLLQAVPLPDGVYTITYEGPGACRGK